MPFNLRNASQTFINSIVQDLDFVFAYIDDLLIGSKSEEEHKQHLEILFHRLSDNCLSLNPSKCVFGASSLKFLSHTISEHGIAPSQKRVEAIINMPPPSSIRQIQQFVGMINYYNRFIPYLAELLSPIHTHLANLQKIKKKTRIIFTCLRSVKLPFQNPNKFYPKLRC